MDQPVVPYIAMPLHSMFGLHYMAAWGLWRGATTRQLNVVSSPSINSVLPANFNEHLCSAWNMRESHGVTHFAMLHGDVDPQSGWFDVLFDELAATNADVISAIIPIKNHDGWTSTAIGHRLPNGKPWNQKLTMHDVFTLPETFGIEDTPWHGTGEHLLLNTGCMAFRLDPWVRDFLLGESFGFETWCEENEDGKVLPLCLSEDWRFSLWCAKYGLRSVATRKVKLNHWGPKPFGNGVPWGNPELNAIKQEEAVA
jgi:hypothetical protein